MEQKPWWPLVSTLAVAAVFVIPIVVLVIVYIVRAVRPKPAASAAPAPMPAWSPPRELAGLPARKEATVVDVTFTLTQNDYMALQEFLAKKRGTVLRTIIYAVIFALVFGLGAGTVLKLPPLGTTIMIAVIALVSGPDVLLDKRRKAKEWATRNSAYFSETTVTIGAEGFRLKNLAEDTSVKWAMVRDIVENKPYIYLFVGRAASIVPERSFGSPDGARQFLESALGYWNSAKSSPASRQT